MELTNHLVSVIIPTYNRSNYLEKTILSVINQTYKNLEIIIVDDGSTDNYAQEICSKYKKCIYLRKKNGGVSSARNFGVKNAKGIYIAFLDDDDLWLNTKIEEQVKVLDNSSDVDCVHGPVAVIDENEKKTGVIYGASQNKIDKRSGYVFWNALGVWLVKASTPVMRKDVFQNNLSFDEELEVGEDTDFYQRMFYNHKVKYINKILTYYRVHSKENSLSSQKEKYIGLENKIFENFVKMGIRNPITLNRIARKLLKSKIKNINKLKSSNERISFYKKYIFPINTLKNIK